MKRAAVYARVSTLQQEQEATIESQVAEVEQYAKENALEVQAEWYFLDQGVSGAYIARPALDRLRDMAAERVFDVVLCLSPDRLSRQYVHQWVIMDDLRQAGVEVIFTSHPMNRDDPQGQLLLGIHGLFAEYERAMITERMRRGKLYRVRRGELVNPVAPYGYRYIPVTQPGGGQWVEHPVEAEVVRQIFEWYTDDGYTMKQIANSLNACPEETPPRGKRWRYSTVQVILTQKAYTGEMYYNRTCRRTDTIGQPKKQGRGYRKTALRVPRPSSEWITSSAPILVTPEMWQQAQDKIALNKKFSPRNNHSHFYLLRSLLVCQVCGRTLFGSKKSAQSEMRYMCSNRGKERLPDVPEHSISISASVIEPLVWEELVKLLRNPTLIADAWQSQSEPDPASQTELERLQTRLRVLDRQWLRILDAFQGEMLSKEEMAERKVRLDHERCHLEERIQQAQLAARKQQAKEKILEKFTDYCQSIESSLENASPELMREVLRLLVDHIVVGKDEIVIKHIVPSDDDARLIPRHRSTQIHTDISLRMGR